jgi:hypothetical protein
LRPIHLWAFDLLAFNGRAPAALLARFGCPAISLSEPFEDALALRVAREKWGLEG